ncbi:hypothetical protein MHLP_02800 [Candidatus Mycoplasma haematolamae str. Purdue]|uniref:Uncharacterized protein n=1 Tax=Mycoplasma haematolamae (strain Purdue) TaxID=1212765 RepID=I7BA28_MYCHA|nr:hypothetical protein [Candidatus Mycoplasma haematolamae]AFO52140.1 hypothetical protein MHLP_02800 [Candidatus Mycoplasma haematolamae str. Purdue]
MTPVLAAKIFVPIGTIGGVSAAATPAIVSRLDQGKYFRFRDSNGKQEAVYLYCPFVEDQVSYPKVDWEKRQVVCGYGSKAVNIAQQYMETITKHRTGLSCTLDDDKVVGHYKCHIKSFEYAGPQALKFTE